ncbi:MAG: hypothetical protein Q9160_007585 [Pyrenula sp. 1 TL-2023]
MALILKLVQSPMSPLRPPWSTTVSHGTSLLLYKTFGIYTDEKRFYRDYDPLVPILSSKPNPNEVFLESPLKFWVIVAIGSRKSRGAKLWAYAIILNESAMAINGYPVNDILASRHLSGATSETNLDSQNKTLKSLVMAFEAELLTLLEGTKSDGALHKIQFAIGRLQIRSLILLSAPSASDKVDLTQLSNAAITTIHEMKELERTHRISHYCPNHIFHGILLAAYSASTTGPETGLDDESAKEFNPVFFDDIWGWDVDWGSIMPAGVMG